MECMTDNLEAGNGFFSSCLAPCAEFVEISFVDEMNLHLTADYL